MTNIGLKLHKHELSRVIKKKHTPEAVSTGSQRMVHGQGEGDRGLRAWSMDRERVTGVSGNDRGQPEGDRGLRE